MFDATQNARLGLLAILAAPLTRRTRYFNQGARRNGLAGAPGKNVVHGKVIGSYVIDA
ncbi:hypothetical protein D3C72_2116000 [compost metagenome]